MIYERTNFTYRCEIKIDISRERELKQLLEDRGIDFKIIKEHRNHSLIETERMHFSDLKVLDKYFVFKKIKSPLKQPKNNFNEDFIVGFNGCLITGRNLKYEYKLKT